jgi:sec-independent protein translocase protein TatA
MNLGPLEVTMIILVILLLFGAKKLPELARGSGRALRIFKAETKGLMEDEDDTKGSTKDRTQDPSETRDEQTDGEGTRELEGPPRGPLHADSVRTDLSYDERPGDPR